MEVVLTVWMGEQVDLRGKTLESGPPDRARAVGFGGGVGRKVGGVAWGGRTPPQEPDWALNGSCNVGG